MDAMVQCLRVWQTIGISGERLRGIEQRVVPGVVVIAHGRHLLPGGALSEQLEDQWLSLQRDLASRFKHHRFIVAERSGHNIPLEQPDLVVGAVKRLIRERHP
ncbi:MAG: hypothetical protein M3495_21445 [Pseudomonadota bacterium]|nr:hypothetical protein [Pseudomonadota bacterium]